MNNTTSEYSESVALFNWILWNERNYPVLKLFHAIPNGAYMTGEIQPNGRHFSVAAMKMKSSGMRPGIPDYFLPAPKKDSTGQAFHGLYLELKTGSNNPDQEQLEFLVGAETVGYKSVVAWNAEPAIALIERYLNGAPIVGMFFGVSTRRLENLEKKVEFIRRGM